MLRVRRLDVPLLEIFSEDRMQRYRAVGSGGFGFTVLALCPALRNADLALIPQDVGPAQRENLRGAERGVAAKVSTSIW